MYGGKTDMERYRLIIVFRNVENDLIDENTINFKYDSVKTLSVLLSVNKNLSCLHGVFQLLIINTIFWNYFVLLRKIR